MPTDIDLDIDRIYFLNTSALVRIADDESERIATELIPTDDPDKYVMRITTPVPRFYIKEAKINS